MRLDELAQRLGLDFEGDPATLIQSAAELDSAGPADLAFVGHKKFWAAAAGSTAACLIVTPDFPTAARPLLRGPEPRAAFAAALRLLYPPDLPPPGIHPTAVVDPTATLGAGVSIGPFTVIEAGAEIGAHTVIGSHCSIGAKVRIGAQSRLHPRVTIYAGVHIGARAILHSGVVLGADGFGFAPVAGRWEKFPQVGGLTLGDDVELGANTCIDRAALGLTTIGNGVKFDNMVHIAHNCRIEDHVVIAAQTGLSGGVSVGHHAIIGGQVGIGNKARIESGAILGSGCGVLTSKIVRAGEPVWGTPARPLREYLTQLAQMAKLPQMREELQALRALLKQSSAPPESQPATPSAPDSQNS